MMILSDNAKKEILNDFNIASKKNYWKTLGEIADDTNVEIREVIKVVFNEPEFVMARYKIRNGEPLFTTKEAYRKHASFVMKFLMMLRNVYGE